MRAEITPTGNPERLKENLEKRVQEVETDGSKLVVELEDAEVLSRTPGIESYKVNGEKHEGLKGSPVEEEAYARIENEEDAVKAFLATVEGYDLRILNSGREWDLRQLKKYNPDIKHLKLDEPKEFLEIEKAISDVDGVEKVDVELPENRDEIMTIYREMLT